MIARPMATGVDGTNLSNTVRLPDPENRWVGKHSAQLSLTWTELYRFEVSIGRNAVMQII